jgi:thymidylate synthase
MNNNVDKQYFELIRHIINNGVIKKDRTGTGTISIFDYTMRFNMSEGFPLLTSKKIFIKGVIHELIWILRGDTNIKYLVDNNVHIWDGDAYKRYLNKHRDLNIKPLSKEEFINKIKEDDDFAKNWGELGPIYGAQWRSWGKHHIYDPSISLNYSKLEGEKYIDQILKLIDDLKNDPDSRRLIVSAWNVEELDYMSLPPCHYGFQCYTQEMDIFERKKYWCDSIGKSIYYAEDFTDDDLDNMGIPKRKISLKWTQRSCDVPLGIPFNISFYGFLLHLLAKEVNMVPNELIFSGGDCHIYLNQIDSVKYQLNNKTFSLPKLVLKNKTIHDLKYEDFQIIGYQSSDAIKIPLSN